MPSPLALAIPCLALTGALPAQPPPAAQPSPPVQRPDAAGRVVKVCDFEERDTNPGEVPRDWFRDQDAPGSHPRPGFPPWNLATVAYDGLACRGVGAARLPTRGGSTSLVMASGVIPVFVDADYRAWAKVRTQGLKHAGACLAARFLDASGHTLPGPEFRSEVVRSDDAWTDIHVDAPGLDPKAAYLQLELMLLQPEQAARGEPIPFKVWSQDFEGAAWFDDLQVVQLPRVALGSESSTNVFIGPSLPQMRLLVRDLAGEVLDLRAEVRDATGTIVDTWERRTTGGETAEAWSPRLPAFGWYHATLRVHSVSGEVGGSESEFLWTPPFSNATGETDRQRLGLVLSTFPQGLYPLARRLASDACAGAVTLPAWSRDLTVDAAPARAKALGAVVNALVSDWREVSLSLPELPDDISKKARVDAQAVWEILAGDPKLWTSYALPYFDTLGGHVTRWQIGGPGDDTAYWRPGLSAESSRIRATLSSLMPKPILVLPTRIDRDWSGARVDASLAPAVPFDMDPTGVGLASRAWAAHDDVTPDVSMIVSAAPPGRYPPHAAAAALARQVARLWFGAGHASHPPNLAIHDPFTLVPGPRAAVWPRPELGAWRTLAEHLAGRRPLAELPVGDGVVALVFGPAPDAPTSRGGCIVAWNEGTLPELGHLTGFVGDGPIRVVDLDGNTAPAPAQAPAPGRLAGVDIPLTESPVFIEGIDLELVRLLASLRLDPTTIETDRKDHELGIVIENPWPASLSGRVSIIEPGGASQGQRDRSWRISPRAQSFSIPASKGVRIPVVVGFSAAEEAGPRDFILRLNLAGERAYEGIELRRTVMIGSSRFRLDLTAHAQGDDLVVEASVGNTASSAFSVSLTAFAPGMPRIKGVLAEIAPGHQAARRFVFPKAAASLRGQRVMVRVLEPESGDSLSRAVTVP